MNGITPHIVIWMLKDLRYWDFIFMLFLFIWRFFTCCIKVLWRWSCIENWNFILSSI